MNDHDFHMGVAFDRERADQQRHEETMAIKKQHHEEMMAIQTRIALALEALVMKTAPVTMTGFASPPLMNPLGAYPQFGTCNTFGDHR
jgi:hypothetical protein